jgi:hypothetical protein
MAIECQKCKGRAQLFLCPSCIVELRRQLLDMPRFVEHLKDSAIGNTRLSNDSYRQLGFESRTPIFDDRATDLIDEIHRVLGQWARPMARTHGYVISPSIAWHRPDLPYTHTSYDYAVFLAAHVNDLANDPDVGELCAVLRRCVKQTVAVVSRPVPSQFCGPCPATIHDHRRCVDENGVSVHCSGPHQCSTSLMVRRGLLEVTCPSCAAVHRVETLVTRLLAHANEHKFTITVLYRVLRMLNEPVPMSTLYRWAEPKSSRRGSGQLKPAGYMRPDNRRIGITRHSAKDKPVYLVSDARKLNRLREQKKSEGRQRK